MAGISISGMDSLLETLDFGGSGTASYTVRADTDYAVYVEFGSSRNKAQPFLRPAVEETMRDADSLLGDEITPDSIAEAVAEDIADNAQRIAPVDTGKLERSIEVRER
ncbi:HK97-gp10 family putative phage morphogenesis protein [Natronoglomus mannanivorans]|uniref:HK97 gp10 family phage protein n=1 Tax=Natronoglomus mannanivorans TaxID=2979990 RepID=A0AAP2Z4M1_9EURY|nr:HK97 gp10 family phage protein [Halobacteria archaeon AArc-xg1-1]